MSEIWKDIPGYEGHYQASAMGEIRSVKHDPIVLKGDFQKNGYRRVYLWADGKKRNCLVHRLVAMAFIDNPNNYSDINHIDEDKTNNAVTNLEWCSHYYNMHYGSVIEKIGNANKGKPISEEHRMKLKKDSSNKRWVNNGVIEKFVYSWNVEMFIREGWKRGRLKRRTI